VPTTDIVLVPSSSKATGEVPYETGIWLSVVAKLMVISVLVFPSESCAWRTNIPDDCPSGMEIDGVQEMVKFLLRGGRGN